MIDNLPPTQLLILEVLSARARSGERMWTFPTKLAGPLRLLEDAGLVSVMSGNVEHTVRAELTDRAEAELLDGGAYRSPTAAGWEQAVRVLADVAHRTGSPAAAWAASYLDTDPDRVGPGRTRGSLTVKASDDPTAVTERVEKRMQRYADGGGDNA